MKIIKCFPGFKFKTVTFSFDDGTFQDIEMINMLNALNMKGTFNLNSNLMYKNSKFLISDWLVNYRLDKHQINDIYKGHEIAGHTSNHTDFKNESEILLKTEIDDDIKALTKLIGKKVVGFAYPYGIYNLEIIQRLKDNGIIYARSTKSTFNFKIPNDWYTYGGTCTISDEIFPKLINKWLKLKSQSLKLFFIWGHSYELDMYHEHEKVYECYKKIANKEDTWYATNEQIVNYLNAFNSLKYLKKENKIINNSNYDLYIIIDERRLIISAKSFIQL